jgi:hypothetical protein
VIVTSWTDARISWPRYRPLDLPRSHPFLLVDEELARAIRHESAAAAQFWWGTSAQVVKRWSKALSVTRTNNEGSRRRRVRKHYATGPAWPILFIENNSEESDSASRRTGSSAISTLCP